MGPIFCLSTWRGSDQEVALRIDFHVQDPTHAETVYLFEAIVAAAEQARSWYGLYAFASRNGVNQLIHDPVIARLMERGGDIDLVVGIDAVTNRQTLERLQELERHHPTFRPRVFRNATRGLFHPKVSRFTGGDGSQTLIVGSGNFTPGGLTQNFEAYTIIKAERGEVLDLASFDQFVSRQADNIRTIDVEALERAARNIIRTIPRAAAAPAARLAQARHAAADQFNRVLIAQVPRADERWAQLHLNADVIEQFFRITDRHTQRVFLTQITPAGEPLEEEVRPCVFSERNRNYKIEIGAARGLAYPDAGRPVIAFRETQVRSFDYMLLMPGDVGYQSMFELTERLPTVGRGLPRVIATIDQVTAAWPQSPLVRAFNVEEGQL